MSNQGVTRREAITASTVAAAGLALPAPLLALAGSGCVRPRRLPEGIEARLEPFENWCQAISLDGVWTCRPRSAEDVARLANWAHREGWRLRPRGAVHGWAPFTVTPRTGCDDRVLLADTIGLGGTEIVSREPAAVRVGAGVSLEELLLFLQLEGYGLNPVPSTGPITVGGALAVGAHGATLPARGEEPVPGNTYGSIANLVLELTAVVWSRRRGRYVARRFGRDHPDAKALTTHLGRAFITEVVLRVIPDQNLRCVSRTDIPAKTFFDPNGRSADTFGGLIDEAGSVEAIWFPFSERPWVKHWSVAPRQPEGSRSVTQPYPYTFSDNIPEPVTRLIGDVMSGNPEATPAAGMAQAAAVDAGLDATGTRDLWGPAMNLQLYVKPTTLRVDDLGLAILTRRRDIQRIAGRIALHHARRLDEMSAAGRYPSNSAFQIRCTGIDRPGDCGIEGAESPVLAPSVPRRDRPWDAVIWLNVLAVPGTAGEYAYFRELERWIRRTFAGEASVRQEWSKCWAASHRANWDDDRALRRIVPGTHRVGRRADEDWDWAARTLRRFDPHGVFSSPLHRRLGLV